MRNPLGSFYAQISALLLALLLLLGGASIGIAFRTALRFVQEADQRLGRDYAAHIAAELEPLVADALAVESIGEAIHYMMVLNPKVEIYLIDHEGRILAFFADPPGDLLADRVDTRPIERYLKGPGRLTLGADPRDPGRTRPFSAAPVRIAGGSGFVYIVLGGQQFASVSAMVRNSYIARTGLAATLLALAFTAAAGFSLLGLLTRRLRRMVHVVREFEEGRFDQRATVQGRDELARLAQAFNKMADTIVANIDRLEEGDRRRREMLANISHDLRSPLASIRGYTETMLMRDDRLSEADRGEYLRIIQRNGDRLGRLVEDLLELARLDADEIEPERTPFQIAELLQDIVLQYKDRALQTEITLAINVPRDLPLVAGDIGLLERVIVNLLENALRFTPKGGSVTVAARQEENAVTIEVEDTGCGIPADEVPRVFERFYRVEKSRNLGEGGTGLGLAIAKRITELHGSPLHVESQPDQGSRFFFSLSQAV